MSVRRFSAEVLAASAGVFIAATMLPAPAQADPADVSGLLGAAGIGNNGPITQLIEQIGLQICPLIVKPGGNLVSNATTASGHGGLASQVTGFVAEQAIQSQCPAVMTQLANGNITPLMQMLSTANQASNTLNTLSGTATPALPSLALPNVG
jgi:hypothetical protein